MLRTNPYVECRGCRRNFSSLEVLCMEYKLALLSRGEERGGRRERTRKKYLVCNVNFTNLDQNYELRKSPNAADFRVWIPSVIALARVRVRAHACSLAADRVPPHSEKFRQSVGVISANTNECRWTSFLMFAVGVVARNVYTRLGCQNLFPSYFIAVGYCPSDLVGEGDNAAAVAHLSRTSIRSQCEHKGSPTTHKHS